MQCSALQAIIMKFVSSAKTGAGFGHRFHGGRFSIQTAIRSDSVPAHAISANVNKPNWPCKNCSASKPHSFRTSPDSLTAVPMMNTGPCFLSATDAKPLQVTRPRIFCRTVQLPLMTPYIPITVICSGKSGNRHCPRKRHSGMNTRSLLLKAKFVGFGNRVRVSLMITTNCCISKDLSPISPAENWPSSQLSTGNGNSAYWPNPCHR